MVRLLQVAVGYGGKALFCIDELSRIALERCNTSRCAVETMGSLAEKYGFYGAENGMEGGSESLVCCEVLCVALAEITHPLLSFARCLITVYTRRFNIVMPLCPA